MELSLEGAVEKVRRRDMKTSWLGAERRNRLS
jgi:hypothetical protein